MESRSSGLGALPPQAPKGLARQHSPASIRQQNYHLEVPKKLGTAATVSSRGAVDQLMAQRSKKHKVAKRLLKLQKAKFLAIQDFNYELGHPSHVWEDEQSISEFYQLCLDMCSEAEPLFRKEHMLLIFDDAPMYVLGDIHGNYKDLMLFEKTFWRLGINLCPANVLCLGDFVDRGPHSVETIAYLVALKMLAPHKIFLIRGNHEVKDVNGDFQVYGKTSFLYQCTALFGQTRGKRVWEAFNLCFDQLPIAAIINNRIFCVHGGVPRQLMRAKERILNEIEHIPKGYIDIARNELVNDLLWADPSVHNEEKLITPSDRFPEGFAPNSMRGGEACVFGTAAVQFFNRVTGCTHIIRAHQPPDLGISLGKNAKVITVFSSSHYCGQFNSAAVVLISDYRIHVIVTTHNQKLVDSPRASRRMEDVRQQQLQAEYQLEEEQAREEEEEQHQQQLQQQQQQYQQQQQHYQQQRALSPSPVSTFSAPIASSASQNAPPTQPFLKPSPLAALPRLGEQPAPASTFVGKQPVSPQPPAYGKQGPSINAQSSFGNGGFVNGIQPGNPSMPPAKAAGAPAQSQFGQGMAARGKVRSFSRQLGFQRSLSSEGMKPGAGVKADVSAQMAAMNLGTQSLPSSSPLPEGNAVLPRFSADPKSETTGLLHSLDAKFPSGSGSPFSL